MSQFILDYTDSPPKAVRRKTVQHLLTTLFVTWVTLSPLLMLGLVAGVFHYKSAYQSIHYQHKMQLLRYDSLHMAKQETDRRVWDLIRQQNQIPSDKKRE